MFFKVKPVTISNHEEQEQEQGTQISTLPPKKVLSRFPTKTAYSPPQCLPTQ
jgi:hypothetical protein